MIITPALINPLRWINTSDLNKSFDGDFAKNQLQWYQSKRCYFQPFETGDRLRQQVIADTAPEDLKIVDCFTNQVIVSIPFALVPTVVLPETPTFSIYELDYSFAGLAIGRYYASLEDFTSQPFEIAAEHINTTLIKYKHSDNDYDVVFDTGIEFQLRVESLVDYDSPKANRDVYYDQPHNSTQLNSVTFRNFKLYLGFQWGLPQWMFDKVAHILGCDQVTYDDIAYQVAPDAEFEAEKNNDNNWMGGSIDVQPVDNNFIKYITSGVVPPPSFKPMQKVVKLTSISGDQTVSNVFKVDSFLRQVTVYKTGADYTLRIGTSIGGNEIGEWLIDDNTGANFEVTYPFDSTTNVYLSGVGLNADRLYLVYDQLDEPDIPLTPQAAQDGELKNSMKFWLGTLSEINDTWDDATGLGKANTGWEKWTWAGFNGTPSFEGKVPIGLPYSDLSLIGSEIGNADNLTTIAKANLPAEGLFTIASEVNNIAGQTPTNDSQVAGAGLNGGTLAYQLRKANGPATVGLTSNMGSGVAMNITPDGRYVIPIIKLVD